MKNSLFLFLVCLPALVNAENRQPTGIELEALAQANNAFNRSLVDLGRVEENCKKSAGTLPSDVFQGLDMEEEDKKKALLYHYLKASSDCTSDALKDYLVSSALLTSLLYPFDPDRARMLNEGNELIMDTRVRLLKAEVEYGQLEEGLRAALDRIDELKKPFKLIESADAIGLN